MNKVLVELYCAATIKKYDMWFPKSMKIREVINQLIEQIEDFENNNELFQNTDKIMLYLSESRDVLNRDYTVEQCGIVSGQRIMMV